MASESKLLKLFKLLLGDKYKIVPLSDEEKRKSNSNISEEDLENITDLVSDSDSQYIKDEGDEYETDTNSAKEDIDESNDADNISAEALALFEQDQKKYGISIKHEDSPVEVNDQDLIADAQEVYGNIVDYLARKIQNLSSSKKTARESYIDILKNGDKDDPYRAQMADNYNPLYIQEQIDYYKRIEQDPFYGRFKLLSQDGKTIEVFVGRIAFEENGVTIVSPWSDFGKAFRKNRANCYIKGKYYNVMNKYTYISKNGKIIGVKDESPR